MKQKANLSICPGVSEVRDDSSDVFGGCPATSVDHDEKLHQIFVGRRARGLHQKHVAPSHALLQLNVYLSVRKPLYLYLPQL